MVKTSVSKTANGGSNPSGPAYIVKFNGEMPEVPGQYVTYRGFDSMENRNPHYTVWIGPFSLDGEEFFHWAENHISRLTRYRGYDNHWYPDNIRFVSIRMVTELI